MVSNESENKPTPYADVEPEEVDQELNKVYGIETDFPVTSWSTFSFGKDNRHGDGGKYILGQSSHQVSLNDLREMYRKDAQTGFLFGLFMYSILSCLAESKWVKAPWVEDGDDEVDFANALFRTPFLAGGMETPISLVLKQHLLAILEGFSAFEVVPQRPKSGPLKGKYTIRGIEYRDSRTVDILIDDFGKQNGLLQTVRRPDGAYSRKEIPKNRTLLYTVGAEKNPHVGVSMFENAWYHYDTKVKLYYVAHKAAQVAAIPARIGTYPAKGTTPTKQAAFSNALSRFATNSSLAIPEGYKVDSFATNSGFDFLALIEHHNEMQAKSVLLNFMNSDNRASIIDNGGQDASADMFVQALMSIMNDISELWTTQLMPKFIDWNFGTGKYPVWKFGELTDSARSDIVALFTTMVTSTTLNSTPELSRSLEKAIANRLGLDIDYKEIQRREEEAAKKAAELAKTEADALEAEEKANQLEAEQQNAQPPQIKPESPAPGGGENAPDMGSQNAPGIGKLPPTTPAQVAAMSSYQDEIDALVELATEIADLSWGEDDDEEEI